MFKEEHRKVEQRTEDKNYVTWLLRKTNILIHAIRHRHNHPAREDYRKSKNLACIDNLRQSVTLLHYYSYTIKKAYSVL